MVNVEFTACMVSFTGKLHCPELPSDVGWYRYWVEYKFCLDKRLHNFKNASRVFFYYRTFSSRCYPLFIFLNIYNYELFECQLQLCIIFLVTTYAVIHCYFQWYGVIGISEIIVYNTITFHSNSYQATLTSHFCQNSRFLRSYI